MVQVLIKAFDILELVAQRQGTPISLTEISAELDINQATAANIINTMVEKDYLEHIGKKKGYRLGPACFRLNNSEPYEQHLLNAAKEAMRVLTEEVKESSLLGIMRNQKRYIVHVENSSQVIQVQARSERNMYDTASGRVLLAYLSEKELDRFLLSNGLPEGNSWEGVSDKKTLLAAFEKIKTEKLTTTYVYGREIKGFAAPIFKNNSVVASLSVFIPEYRCTASKEKEIVANLRATCEKINKNMENI
jgi:DNA-binding IclR family transcriptional regulator